MTNEELIAADRQSEIDHAKALGAKIQEAQAALDKLVAEGDGKSPLASLQRAVIAELRYDLPSEQRKRAFRERMAQ
jgi:hypothetical protein